jgi:RecG-like helicase
MGGILQKGKNTWGKTNEITEDSEWSYSFRCAVMGDVGSGK